MEGRRRANEALARGRETVQRNKAIRRRAKEAAERWLKDFSPSSPLVDALVDENHLAHAGVLEHAQLLLRTMRAAT